MNADRLLRFVRSVTLLCAGVLAGCTAQRAVGLQCVFNDDCAQGLVCASSTCRQVCAASTDCPSGMTCGASGQPGQTACLPGDVPSRPCAHNSDCSAGQLCGPGAVCQPMCNSARDCVLLRGPSYTCSSAGLCVTAMDASVEASAPDASPDVVDPNATTVTIGVTGGSLALGEVRLWVPAGALTGPVALTIRRVATAVPDGGAPDGAARTDVTDTYGFLAAGGTLPLAPGQRLGVEFDVGDASMPPPQRLRLDWSAGSSTSFQDIGGLLEQRDGRWVMRALVSHFSLGVVRAAASTYVSTVWRAAASRCQTAMVSPDGVLYVLGGPECAEQQERPRGPIAYDATPRVLLGGVVEVAAAGAYLFARRFDDQVLLVHNRTDDWSVAAPIALPALAGWHQLRGGGSMHATDGTGAIVTHTAVLCGLNAQDTWACLGSDAQGALSGTAPPDAGVAAFALTPVALPAAVALTRVTEVQSSGQHSCALGFAGTQARGFCWGEGYDQQLSNQLPSVLGPSHSAPQAPFQLTLRRSSDTGGLPMLSLALSRFATCGVVLADGDQRVGCVGGNYDHEVTELDLSSMTFSTVPELQPYPSAGVPSVAVVFRPPSSVDYTVPLAAGDLHFCMLAQGSPATVGEVLCWGDNSRAQTSAVGTATSGRALVPRPMLSDAAAVPTAVYAGEAHSCALYSNGQFFCWGDNRRGQLASDPKSSESGTPQEIRLPPHDSASID